MELGNIKPVSIVEQMTGAYLDYSMSVIVSRALPDVRDGLKPVVFPAAFARCVPPSGRPRMDGGSVDAEELSRTAL